MVATSTLDMHIETDAPLPTWFGIGGVADRLARPRSLGEVVRCVQSEPDLRVLGDGANLLVDDDGIGELVLALTDAAMTSYTINGATGAVTAMAGANLPRLINETVRTGLAGLEGLAGIPATVGGAVVMNAGGAFGQIADAVARVRGVDRAGNVVTLERREIDFGYRRSGLNDLVITSVELALVPDDREKIRARQKDVMAYKKRSQPMAEPSAGCVFKNPTLAGAIDRIGDAGARVSAGMLIDLAGCKGLRTRGGEGGGAEVSPVHGNFIVTHPGALAREVIDLMGEVKRRVFDRFGVELEPEVVVWRRSS